MIWNTDTKALAAAIDEFEKRLPGFWWSIGMCNIGAHASCGVDSKGAQAHLLDNIPLDDPFNGHIDVDTDGGTPAEALVAVMHKALADPRLSDRRDLAIETHNPAKIKPCHNCGSKNLSYSARPQGMPPGRTILCRSCGWRADFSTPERGADQSETRNARNASAFAQWNRATVADMRQLYFLDEA